MGISGKYDFKGIKKHGAAGLRLALAASPASAWLLRFGALTDLILEFLANWLANNGLMVMNLGAIFVEGELDQKHLDDALDMAIEAIKRKGGREALTPDERKAIDDEVIKAARKFVVISRR